MRSPPVACLADRWIGANSIHYERSGRGRSSVNGSLPVKLAAAVFIFASISQIIQHSLGEPADGNLVDSLAALRALLPRMGVMPGVKYFLRQANAFLALAQETADARLKERYRMMAEKYRAMATEPTAEPPEADRRTGDAS
jgi:hypothetical protein